MLTLRFFGNGLRRVATACALAGTLALAGCASGTVSSASGVSQAANSVGSVAVDGSQITVRLDDDMTDGYTWQTSIANDIVQDTQSAVEDEEGKATFVYSVGADVDSSIEFYYVNDEDPSDVKYAETLAVRSDGNSNPTKVELVDANGETATIVR